MSLQSQEGNKRLAKVVIARYANNLHYFRVLVIRLESVDTLDDVGEVFEWSEGQPNSCGSYVTEGDLKEEMEELCDHVYAFGKMVFGIEEMALLCGSNFLPPALSRITRLGRHQSLSVVYTTQRAGEISRALTAATDIFVLFHFAESRDLAAIPASFASCLRSWLKSRRGPVRGFLETLRDCLTGIVERKASRCGSITLGFH